MVWASPQTKIKVCNSWNVMRRVSFIFPIFSFITNYQGVNMNKFLTISRLEHLYNSVSCLILAINFFSFMNVVCCTSTQQIIITI